jgi:uncharacterized protein
MSAQDFGREGRDDKLFEYLERQLEGIETDEYLHGMTGQDLAEKGLTATQRPAPERRRVRETTEPERLGFEEGVDYARLPGGTDADSVPDAELDGLGAVAAGALMATRRVGAGTRLRVGANVRKEIDESTERYFAVVNGYAVLAGDAFLVVPADADCRVGITVSADSMTAVMACSRGKGRGRMLSVASVHAALLSMGVTHGIDQVAIEKALNDANRSGNAVSDTMVAAGTPPIRGADGVAEYAFSDEPKECDFKILPDGRVDYRSTCNISMAAQGQTLATLRDPTQGTPGRDVRGRVVAAENGKPASLAAGEGVTVSPDGKTFEAAVNGAILLNGSVVEVVNTYVVNGDIDFSTGNIDFDGTVVINGAVLDGFEVKASGDIVIAKNVESARVEAGRDVLVRGGVQGKGKGLVAAGRDIHVGYAQSARLEAQGSIHVDNFAINSYLFTSRNLYLTRNKGAIIGGETYAQKGIDARALGSENGVKTYVTVGADFLVLRKIAEIDRAIVFLTDSRDKIDGSLKATARMLESGKTLPEDKRALVQRVMDKRAELDQRLKVMAARRADLHEQSMERATCFVKASGECYPDVYLKIRDQATVVKVKRQAVKFYEDRDTGEIAVGAY